MLPLVLLLAGLFVAGLVVTALGFVVSILV